MGIIVAIHVIVCVSLIGIILIQRGRGGGLVDSLSGMESVFGTKTTAFLTRSTSVLAVIFFLTCLSLGFFSLRQSRSLIRNAPVPPPVHNATVPRTPVENTPPAAPAPVAVQGAAGNATSPAK
jgi:preprotein translocase subunit SecG